jgi:hypothetical protein
VDWFHSLGNYLATISNRRDYGGMRPKKAVQTQTSVGIFS